MQTNKLILLIFIFSILFSSCEKEANKEKIVEMIIYPTTGYGASIISNIITEPLVFSESDNTEKQLMLDIIFEDFNIKYTRGYQYTLKVKKIWMKHPPQDVSSIKYKFMELISKEKSLIQNKEENLKLKILSKKVKFLPQHPIEYKEDGTTPIFYDALHAINTENNSLIAIKKVDGFNFEENYEYIINVKKNTTVNPFNINYKLINIVSKKMKKE